MAEYFQGILGQFSGKVGTVIGTTWRGKNIMRSISTRRSKKTTQLQLDQQEKFSLVIGFVKTMTDLLETTFKAYAIGMTGANAAGSYNLQNAISGAVSPFNISFPNVLVSRGDLPSAKTASATAIADNKVQFSWTSNDGIGKTKDNDKVILVVYCPALNHTVYVLGGNTRSQLTQTLDVEEFTGETVETWVAFITNKGSITSNSMYAGSVNIEP